MAQAIEDPKVKQIVMVVDGIGSDVGGYAWQELNLIISNLMFPRFRGHPRRRKNASGDVHVTTEAKSVYG